MQNIAVVFCLLGIYSACLAQIAIGVTDRQGNPIPPPDKAELSKMNDAYSKERREKYSNARTIADAISIAAAELKEREMPQFAPLLTENQVLRSTKHSLYSQLNEILKRKKIKPNSIEADLQRAKFQAGPIAAFASLENKLFPRGGYFDFWFGKDPDGTIQYFRLFLSAKPDGISDSDFEYTATIFEVKYGANP